MRQQLSPFWVKTVLASNGERLPVLLHRDTGIPVFDAVLWVVSSLRNKGHASETITQALRSLSLLYIVLKRNSIDLTARFAKGEFLDPSEIELVVNASKSTLASSVGSLNFDDSTTPQKKVLPLEKARMAMTRTKSSSEVGSATTAIRLGYIREFLIWRMNQSILRASTEARQNLTILRDLVNQEIKNKTPAVTGKNYMCQRMGLNKDAQAMLLRITDAASPNNPWGTIHTKRRNQVIITGLLELGVRRSELLGVRIRDISAQGHEIQILRRPDDEEDPRLYEPNAKTRDRLLPLSAALNRLIKEYIFMRREIVGGQHDFLLVATGTGQPLSKSEFNRLFSPLQKTSPLLKDIGPHVLRHTFFENLAEDLDQNGIHPDAMEPILRQLGGWSESSSMPQTYTKRYAQRKAYDAALSMQDSLRMTITDEKCR